MASAIWGDSPTTSTTTTMGPARGSRAAGSPSGGGDFLPFEEDGLVPASQWKRGASRQVVQDRIAQAHAAGLTGGPFTLFDEIAGPRILSRRPEWSRRQCVFHAIDVSQVPDPAGRMLNVPIPGWPEPQVLLSRAALVTTHQAIVHLLAGEESLPKVQQVPHGADTIRLHVLCGRFPPTACWSNDAYLHCAEPIPPDADFIRAVESDSIELVTSSLFPGDLPPTHPLQPLYRSHFQRGGYVHRHGFPKLSEEDRIDAGIPPMPLDVTLPDVPSGPSDPSSTLGSSSSSSGGPAPATMQFTVFDVFHHVRVLEVLLPATRLSILRVIQALTPQLGSAFSHRVVCHPLAGFPEPQFVVWDEHCNNQRVFPIMHPDVDMAVCTISVPTSTTIFHLAYVVEQACGTSPDYRHAVAKQLAHISLDETSFPPFMNCDASRVDVASFGWGPPQCGGLAAARWSHPWPRFLPFSHPEHFTNDPASDLILVHRLGRPPVCCHVDPCLRFGQACTSILAQLGATSGFVRLPQVCPAMAGLPLHVALDDRPDRGCGCLAVFDLRPLCGDVGPGFVTTVCPRKFGIEWVRECVSGMGVSCAWIQDAFVDGERLRRAVEPAWPVIFISCVGAFPLWPGGGRPRLPAILDARAVMNLRIGFAQSTMKWKHARSGPLSVRSLWAPAPAACAVLGPDPSVNFDPPSVVWLDCYPEHSDLELFVYCLHEDAFRTWVPRVASHEVVVQHLSKICGLTGMCVLWPHFAPCFSGGACHAVLVPDVLCHAAFAIVDSRRVYPHESRRALRLVQLPDRLRQNEAGSALLEGIRTSRPPGAVALDGLPLRGPLVGRPGVCVVTVFPQGARWTDCVADNWAGVCEHVGCSLHLLALRSTSTTTGEAVDPWLPISGDTTTTTSPPAAPTTGPQALDGAPPGTEVRFVFALPSTRCRSVLWRTDRPVSHALWPLLLHFAQHMPWETWPPLVAAQRFVRDEAGRPILLLTIEHPDFLSSCNAWIYVQDGTFCNFRLVGLDRRMSAASFRRTHCSEYLPWDLLLDGVRAADFPRWHDAAFVSVTPDWRCAVTEPVAALFPFALDLHFMQFPIEVPASLRCVAVSSDVAWADFCRDLDNQFGRLRQFNGYLPDARYVSIAMPDYGLCRLRLVHQLAPTVSSLRRLLGDVWPWFERADVLDCHELIDDGCLFSVQHSRALHAAWFCSMQWGTDLFFVPFGQHPSACIPCPLGHLRVARHEGAFGFLQHCAGPPLLDRLHGWHDVAFRAWEQADRHSTSSEERRILDGEVIDDTSSGSGSDHHAQASGPVSSDAVPPPHSCSAPVSARSLPVGVHAAVVDDLVDASGAALLQIRAFVLSAPADVGPEAIGAGFRTIPTPCRSNRLCPVVTAPFAGAVDSTSGVDLDDVAPTSPVPVALAPCLPPVSQVDSMRVLLRSVMVPWLQGWSRDLAGLDLSPALRRHFSQAPLPVDAPSAFWVFTDGSSTAAGAGCGNVLIAEHGVGARNGGASWGGVGTVSPHTALTTTLKVLACGSLPPGLWVSLGVCPPSWFVTPKLRLPALRASARFSSRICPVRCIVTPDMCSRFMNKVPLYSRAGGFRAIRAPPQMSLLTPWPDLMPMTLLFRPWCPPQFGSSGSIPCFPGLGPYLTAMACLISLRFLREAASPLMFLLRVMFAMYCGMCSLLVRAGLPVSFGFVRPTFVRSGTSVNFLRGNLIVFLLMFSRFRRRVPLVRPPLFQGDGFGLALPLSVGIWGVPCGFGKRLLNSMAGCLVLKPSQFLKSARIGSRSAFSLVAGTLSS